MRAFEKDYLVRYPQRSDAAAAVEAKFVLSVLGLKRGARLLDLGCGAGRHARAFAVAGYNVAGIDLSADLLRAARQVKMPKSWRRRLRYIRADMRRLPLADASLDGAVSMFTSFGYFSSDCEDARVLGEVFRVLKPGATFLMDYFNLQATLAHLVPQSRSKVGDVEVLEKRRFLSRSRRLAKTIELRSGRTREVLRESLRAYTPRELKVLFTRAGFVVERLYGDLDGERFDTRRSPRCVVLARKPEGEA